MIKVVAKNYGNPEKIDEMIKLFAKLASNTKKKMAVSVMNFIRIRIIRKS